MAREAAVRLTLSNAQFVTSIKRSGDAVERVARDGKKGMDAFGAAADRAKNRVLGMATAAKTALRWTASLGGAFTVGNAVKGALALQRSYRQIAFGAKDANGQMLRAAEVQKIVERSAAMTGQANADMAQSFSDLVDATGDVDFARKSLVAVGTTATATGKDLGSIATAADQLHTKFGVSAEGMQDALAQVFGAAKQGGPKFEEFADVMSNVGAELLAAGLEGKQGLDFMLGALVATDDRLRSLPKQVAGLKAVLRGLGEKTELTKLANKIGLDPTKLIKEKDAIARLRRIFGTGQKGINALLGGMHEGEEKETMKILFVEPFQKALAEAQKSGLKGKAAIDRALVTFDNGISTMGRASMDGAQMQREADAARQTPEMQLTAALNTLSNAFAQPRIINAINDLAQHLPRLAEILAQVIGFAAEHPILAGAGAIAGNVGAGIVSGAISEALGGALAAGGGAVLKKMLGKGAGKALAGGAGSALGGAAEVAASGIQRYHQFGMAGGITGEMLGAAPEALTAAELGAAGISSGGFMGAGLGASLAAAALPLAAIAAGGAAAGYGIHSAYSGEGDIMKELQDANAAAGGGGTREQKKAMLERLRAARSAAAKADIGGGALDSFARLFTDVDTRKQANDEIWNATQSILKLQEDLQKPEVQNAGGRVVRMPEQNIVGRVKVESDAARMIGVATATALGGTIIDVRITNGSDIGLGRARVGPGGSRGPMTAGTPQAGGSV